MIISQYTSQQPIDDFGLRFSNLKYNINIPASINIPFTVPGDSNRYKAVIKVQQTLNVWVSENGTASSPSNVNFQLTNSELVTGAQTLCREVSKGDILNFFSITSGVISIVLYSVLD